MERKQTKPLYRKENKQALCYKSFLGRPGEQAKDDRHTKKGMRKSMHSKGNGYDYTPLYKFLLSKVGCMWGDVYSEAVSRLDKESPIWNLVLVDDKAAKSCGVVIMGENTYYSALHVDSDGILQKVRPDIQNEHLRPGCHCCTHTFNGKVLINKYQPERPWIIDPKEKEGEKNEE